MTVTPFQVHRHHLKRNRHQGESMRILPAIEPNGNPGIAVIVDGRPVLVLSQEHAIRLSDSVIDALEAGAPNE
jgi:hypothetical protein